MNTKQLFLLAVASIFAITVISGCGGGGSKSHTVRTPWDGTVAGVDTLPYDDETNVAVDTWIKVYWPNRYFEPSQSFTFRLHRWDGDGWAAVKTIAKDSDPEYGEWWFAPEDNLAYGTDYRITITDDFGNSHVHYFTTEYRKSRAAGETAGETKTYKPEGGGMEGGTPAEEHVIKVKA